VTEEVESEKLKKSEIMKVRKIRFGSHIQVVYERENLGMTSMFRQFLRDDHYTDAKLASQHEPNLVLRGHRVLLSACSRVLHKKFQREPNPNTVVRVDLVDHKNLNYIFQLIYEGKVSLPQDDADSFKASLRSLNVRLDSTFDRIVYDSDDEADDVQVTKQAEQVSTISTPEHRNASNDSDPGESQDQLMPTVVDEKPETKPAAEPQRPFLQSIISNSSETWIQDFSTTLSGSPSSAKKPRIVPPPMPLPTSQDAQVRGTKGLFWVEQKNDEKLSKADLYTNMKRSNVKTIEFGRQNETAYYGFSTSEDAKCYIETKLLVSPKGSMPLAIEDLPKDLEPVPTNVLVKNVPSTWNKSMVLRFFKRNNFKVDPSIIQHSNGEVRVRFSNETTAKSCADHFDNKMVEGNKLSTTLERLM
jgi:hypothetical protein